MRHTIGLPQNILFFPPFQTEAPGFVFFFKLLYQLLKECEETIPKPPPSLFLVYLADFTIP